MVQIVKLSDDTEAHFKLVDATIELALVPRVGSARKTTLQHNDAVHLCREISDHWNPAIRTPKRHPYIMRTVAKGIVELQYTRSVALHLISTLLFMCEEIETIKDRQYTIEAAHPRAGKLLTDANQEHLLDPQHPSNRGFDGPTGAE